MVPDQVFLAQKLAIIAEKVEQLGVLFPTSPAIGNEVHAVRLLQKAFPILTAAEIEMAKGCLDRINVTILTATHGRTLFPSPEFHRFTTLEEAMSSLILETIGVDLPPPFQIAFQEELKSGGCTEGMVYIGFVRSVQDVAYILWHFTGEMPVTMMVPRDRFASEEATREVAQDFILHWNQRIG